MCPLFRGSTVHVLNSSPCISLIQILPISKDPGQVLRTNTGGIGTGSYRAPEVNSYCGYDPSAADIWSLGITLFFMVSHSSCHSDTYMYINTYTVQVGIEEMVKRVSMLDPYSRPLLAPLGIVFPFPMFCSKLDSYMKMEAELSAYFTNAGTCIFLFYT